MVAWGCLLKLREQGGGEADGAEEVGGDGGFGVGEVVLGEEVFGAHDAGVVDDDVEGGVVGGELVRRRCGCSAGSSMLRTGWRPCRGWRRWSRRGPAGGGRR